MNNKIDNVNRGSNYEFSLGNKNDSEKNFKINKNINNINIIYSEDSSLIKPKEDSQHKFYYNDTLDQKNINTNNTFNNEYFRQENFNENQFYNNINTSKQSKFFFMKKFTLKKIYNLLKLIIDENEFNEKSDIDLKLELRNLKKLFYTIKDENQLLFENFELQKKELEKKSENVKIKNYFYIF